MKVIGSCNRCGQCCGLDNGVPAFHWLFFQGLSQYENNPHMDIQNAEPYRIKFYNLIKHLIGTKGTVEISSKGFQAMVTTKDKKCGLVRSETETHCPFLDTEGVPSEISPGGIAHPCLVWGEDWQQAICQPEPVFETLEKWQSDAFFDNHPKCGFYSEGSR